MTLNETITNGNSEFSEEEAQTLNSLILNDNKNTNNEHKDEIQELVTKISNKDIENTEQLEQVINLNNNILDIFLIRDNPINTIKISVVSIECSH